MRSIFLALLLMFGAMVGCSSSSSSPPDTLIYSRGEDANTLDPIHTDIGETVKVVVNIYETLVTYDDTKLELVPGLAERWTMSDDGREWTFQLRPNVRFHDGTPCDAEAVAFTFARLSQDEHPDVYQPAVPYRSHFRVIEEVKATQPLEVRFVLREPSAVFLQNLAMFPASIVSPTAVKKSKQAFGEHPVGTGPFRLLQWNRDQQLVLEANQDYWRKPPAVRRVIFLPIHDDATRVQQLKRGEAHFADDLPAAELAALEKFPGVVVQEQTGLNVSYLTMQTEKPPLNSRVVRRAIAGAIDRARLAQLLFQGHAVPAKTVVPPDMWAHHGQLAEPEFNITKAKEQLAEAAASEGFSLPLKVTLSVMNQPRPYLPEPATAAAFIKDALAEIGVQVTVVARDVNQHFPQLMAGKYELGLAGWTSDNSDPDNFLYSLLDPDNISEHGNNLSRYRNDVVHQLLRAAQREIDTEKRLAMYVKAQEIIADDMPIVPLTHAKIRIAQRANVRDYVLHSSGLVRLRNVRLEAAP